MIFTIVLIAIFTYIFIRLQRKNQNTSAVEEAKDNIEENQTSRKLIVLYASETGTSERLAKLVPSLSKSVCVEVKDISEYDVDNFCKEESYCLFLLPTWDDAKPPTNAAWFYQWLEDMAFDFRTDRDYLKKLKFALFGVGSGDYPANRFNKVAKDVNSWLLKLSAQKVFPLHLADVSQSGGIEEEFKDWVSGLIEFLESGKEIPLPAEIKYESSDEEAKSDDGGDVEDLEDIAQKFPDKKNVEVREMMNPTLKSALTKQGYKVIGSHSGVKICRWTKAMLRGRGGCYKHSFYGIESHRCMETTPSLACANKCVFCWRHHTNPVGTEWKWKMDDHLFILEGAIENHLKMIKQLKGVPGVNPDKFAEAKVIKHCALSLVGEPIMYPKINEFLTELHKRRISSFLVTNAQFPERINQLIPVTQLYLSIDASTKESLKKIDRPLFTDFWERFLACLDELRIKKQRTVYRLTLVKEFNVEELDNYAELIKRGQPDFIEVKGVTFCGYSGSNPLTMTNVPFHYEVIKFVQALQEKIADFGYKIACEHEHSCSMLIAHEKFFVDGKWNTWINYDKFLELSDKGEPFTSLDYMAPTPDWAVFGSTQKGFDPNEERFFRKKGAKEVQIEHGC